MDYDGQGMSSESVTFHGFIDTVEDALLVIEATQRGICRRIDKRLDASEQNAIRSGSIFVYDESEASMKRWTDKLFWSPSRQVGSFFVYRQMSSRVRRGSSMKSLTLDAEHDSSGWPISAASTAAEKPYVGSLTTSSQYNRNGLAKKTLALGNLHVINYFNLDDVQQNKLARPSQSQALAGLTISPELKQAFKVANEVMGRTASTSSSPGVSLSPHSDAAVLGMHPWSLGDASMMHEDDPLLEYPRNRSLSLPALFVDASPSNHSFASSSYSTSSVPPNPSPLSASYTRSMSALGNYAHSTSAMGSQAEMMSASTHASPSSYSTTKYLYAQQHLHHPTTSSRGQHIPQHLPSGLVGLAGPPEWQKPNVAHLVQAAPPPPFNRYPLPPRPSMPQAPVHPQHYISPHTPFPPTDPQYAFQMPTTRHSQKDQPMVQGSVPQASAPPMSTYAMLPNMYEYPHHSRLDHEGNASIYQPPASAVTQPLPPRAIQYVGPRQGDRMQQIGPTLVAPKPTLPENYGYGPAYRLEQPLNKSYASQHNAAGAGPR